MKLIATLIKQVIEATGDSRADVTVTLRGHDQLIFTVNWYSARHHHHVSESLSASAIENMQPQYELNWVNYLVARVKHHQKLADKGIMLFSDHPVDILGHLVPDADPERLKKLRALCDEPIDPDTQDHQGNT